jgi:dinuclear metal center YbgI/SA1388 family protein
MIVKDIVSFFEEIAPLSLQEEYDNAGLIVGNINDSVSGILVTLDVTEKVVQEAIDLGVNLIVAHHPIVFSGLKRFNGSNYVERTVIKAIKNDIAIFAVHTNIDSVLENGVNTKICEKIGLTDTSILRPLQEELYKLVVYTPLDYEEKVRDAIFDIGAGTVGNYSSTSFNVKGEGTFRAEDKANPFIGKKGELHKEQEVRIEMIIPSYKIKRVEQIIKQVHPYEEPAYDIISIKKADSTVGAGMIGFLDKEESEIDFLNRIKVIFGNPVIRYTNLRNKPIKKVAVCGGAGSFLLKDAINTGADIFITGDFKYHQFFDADNQIVIADIGHFESEQFTKELFYELLTIKFSNFAVYFTKENTNPIKYL